MSNSNASRARQRYTTAVYRAALLLAPQPQWAARAIGTAWQRMPWDDVALDDLTEAQLVSLLPKPPRLRLPWKRQPSLVGRGSAFWRLAPPMRLALGLRWLRGFNTPHLAVALRQPEEVVQGLLVHGLAALSGTSADAPTTCTATRRARLDDPAAHRGHVLGCAHCRTTLSAWEASERREADALQRTLGGVPLPGAVAAQLAAQPGQARAVAAWWQRTWVWQLGLIALVAVVISGLLWPRAHQLAAPVAARSPRLILQVAVREWDTLPPGTGVRHREWEIMPLSRTLVRAEEWVDLERPARHRMQLVNNTAVVEWQTGDGATTLNYSSRIAPLVCGPLPDMLQGQQQRQVQWALDADAQLAMRRTRWEHGVWASGKRLLERAASAASVRSLGIAGSGSEAALTLAAQGPTISGTLLLRLDPATFEVREIREVRQNNGQTETRTFWRLLRTETLTAPLTTAALATYPGERDTPPVLLAGDMLDPACPFVEASAAADLGAAIVAAPGRIVGFKQLPPGLDSMTLWGQVPHDSWMRQTDPDALVKTFSLVYVGPHKRLVFRFSQDAPFSEDGRITAGPFMLHLHERLPNFWLIRTQASANAPAQDAYTGLEIWAEGWQRDELVALLATAEVLSLDDWLAMRGTIHSPLQRNIESYSFLKRIIPLLALHPSGTRHEIATLTTASDPKLLALADPYHRRPPPSSRRIERWVTFDAAGELDRFWVASKTMSGTVAAYWGSATGEQWVYDPLGNIVLVSDGVPLTVDDFLSSYLYPRDDTDVYAPLTQAELRTPLFDLQLLLRIDWQWQTTDSGFRATTTQPLHWFLANMPGAVRGWDRHAAAETVQIACDFGADGTLARVTLVNPESQARLYDLVIQASKWQAAPPTDPFTATVPRTTTLIQRQARPSREPSFVERDEIERRSSPQVWLWPPDMTAVLNVGRLPPRVINGVLLAQATLAEAVDAGAAIELQYRTPGGYLNVTQGSAGRLRRLAARTPPPWTSSRQSTLRWDDAELTLWECTSPVADERWAFVERDNVLLVFHHNGPATEWERIKSEISAMTRV